jgi:hypothetical protein
MDSQSRLLKKGHLRGPTCGGYPRSRASLRRTDSVRLAPAPILRMGTRCAALHLDLFEQPGRGGFFSNLLGAGSIQRIDRRSLRSGDRKPSAGYSTFHGGRARGPAASGGRAIRQSKPQRWSRGRGGFLLRLRCTSHIPIGTNRPGLKVKGSRRSTPTSGTSSCVLVPATSQGNCHAAASPGWLYRVTAT